MDPFASFLQKIGPEEAFDCLAELLPEAAVYVVDAERNVIRWSDGATRMLGFSREEAMGKLCLSSIRCRACTLGCGISRGATVQAFPIELYRADERWVATEKYAKGFFSESGDFLGGIEVLIAQGPPRDEATSFTAEFRPPPDAENFYGLVSRDAGMHTIFQTIRNVGETDANVLIHGESGSGKELVARALHLESRRHLGPFLAVNCAALSPGLLESELFGHVRGAFTGAVRDRKGLFEQANSGTLFLDEVAELPLDVQSKLLRVLEERVVTPVGSTREVEVDVRIVAASHRDLAIEVSQARFREDLMYRLRVVPLMLPPLRARVGDVELLLRYFLSEFNRKGPRQVDAIDSDAMRCLLEHDWPGNLRELRNVIEGAFAMGRGSELQVEELPSELRISSPLPERVRRRQPQDPADERERIQEALQLEKGVVSAAANRLGMSRSTLWRKRRLYEL